ncbi:hypothetical protein KK083_30870 [Fulvivirgaceae bacterium PWU4]|uniref:Uncharacterized protein n=1 Tax=Chryseosolibacter histidini TaxID=2782349 RepID=A0AAP2DRT6_9BACT|nr:permease prefix domain 2-containing transporter [Chryseosolibacter histidini]MBT1701336.1 hypothetical protein [Chryseosolibacter histidini]
MIVDPPKWADGFLRWYCHPELLEDIQGDLYELYCYRLQRYGRRYADVKFVWEVLMLCRFSLLKNPFERKKQVPLALEQEGASPPSLNVWHMPTWNDILFETRNKDYGAYVIRNAYGGNMLLGFSVVLLLWIVIFAWWWIKFKH